MFSCDIHAARSGRQCSEFELSAVESIQENKPEEKQACKKDVLKSWLGVLVVIAVAVVVAVAILVALTR